MTVVQLQIPPEDLEAAFQEYEAGENLYSVADLLGIPAPRFERLYLAARGKPEPEINEEIEIVAKKPRKTLTGEQKEKIVKMLENGAKRVDIAEKFGISVSGVDNIRNRAKIAAVEQAVAKTWTVPEPTINLTPERDKSLVSVTLEPDFIVVRIPRKHVLAAILRDLI